MGKTLIVGVLLATLMWPALAAAAAEPVPAESFARIPALQSVSMSADGRQVVGLVALPGGEETGLATWDLDNPTVAPTRLTPSGERMKFIAASALKAGRMLVIARQEWTGQLGGCGEGSVSGATRTFVTKAYMTDSTHSKFEEAFADNTRRIGVSEDTQRCLQIAGTAALVHRLPLDPTRVIVQQLNEASLSSHYYLYDLTSGRTELLHRGGSRSTPGLFHPRTGEMLTRTQIEPSGVDEYQQQVLVKDADTGQFEVHAPLTTRLTERFTVDVTGIDEATGKLYVLTDQFSDRVQAHMYDPRTRTYDMEPLAAHPRFSIVSLVFGQQPSNFNQVVGFRVDGAQLETVYVDPQLKSIHDGLRHAYPDRVVSIDGYNADFSRVLFSAEGPRHPPTFHVLLDLRNVLDLGGERPWIRPDAVGEQRWVTYKARDGLEIPALLDLPAGWKAGDAPLPAIVHPHGGPWSRDRGGWDASGWVPFLTSRGYAVLRPQYRGSAGLGRALWIAGDGEWGRRMQDDKDDGAAWLVAEGIAAKDRIAIFGYSYGGFAAAAATVRPRSPYQCAISGAPVTNLARLGTTWSSNRLQRILQGRTVKGLDPMRHTAEASIPVLLFVGDRDVRTPAFHAKDFHDAVKGRVDARFELVPDMPHSMPWYPRHQRRTLGLIEGFLAEGCGEGGL